MCEQLKYKRDCFEIFKHHSKGFIPEETINLLTIIMENIINLMQVEILSAIIGKYIFLHIFLNKFSIFNTLILDILLII